MRIAFLGTPEFAVPSLKMLCESSHELFVISQPDKAKGRGYKCCSPAVICEAREAGLHTSNRQYKQWRFLQDKGL